MITIAIDAMGGDNGVNLTVPAVINALKKHSDLHIILVGDQALLEKKLSRKAYQAFSSRLAIRHASQIVEMDESPSKAVRQKKDSSMRVAVNLVKEGGAQACVSAGNTGALMATAHLVLRTIPGVSRPAILGMIPAPSRQGFVRMLDLGANICVDAEQLVQFAIMGSVVSEAADHLSNPRVALLNIGEEEMKGNESIKQASKILQEKRLVNYIGFAEGNDIFADKADVIVCDGFVGNVALKTSEGLAKFIRDVIYQSFKRNFLTKILAIVAWPVLASLRTKLNPAKYNGASLVGLNGIVIKSHGGTTRLGFECAINRAMEEVKQNVTSKIQKIVSQLVTEHLEIKE